MGYRSKYLAVMVVVFELALSQTSSSKLRLGEDEGDQRTTTVIRTVPVKQERTAAVLERAVDPSTYRVGPGDSFIISILGVEPYSEYVTITPTGVLVIPLIGTMPVDGLTVDGVRVKVLARVKNEFPTYQADCILSDIRRIRVSVSGAVANPGMYEVTPVSRLTDALRLAGGWKQVAALHRLRLIAAAGKEQIIDITAYYQNSDMKANPYLKAGDQIVVPYSDIDSEMVVVKGEVENPGYYSIKPGEKLSSFLARWIILTKDAELSSIYLARKTAGGEKEYVELGLEDFQAQTLEAGLTIHIKPKKFVAVSGEVVEPNVFDFQPGMTAKEYIAMAGGFTKDGSGNKVIISRLNGDIFNNPDITIEPGDAIMIGKSFRTNFVGQAGMLQVVATFFSIYLAYLAATL